MKLFVFGQNLNDMEQWVKQSFSKIRGPTPEEKTKNAKDRNSKFRERYPTLKNLNPLTTCTHKMYYVQAVKETYELCLNWYLPTKFSNYLYKPCAFWGHIIGHEGVGSLLSYLRNKGLATQLSSGCDTED
eukprot:UN26529